MKIIEFDSLFNTELTSASTTSSSSPTTTTAVTLTSSKHQTTSYIENVNERFIEAAISVLVCVFIYILKKALHWVLNKLKRYGNASLSENPSQRTEQPNLLQI